MQLKIESSECAIILCDTGHTCTNIRKCQEATSSRIRIGLLSNELFSKRKVSLASGRCEAEGSWARYRPQPDPGRAGWQVALVSPFFAFQKQLFLSIAEFLEPSMIQLWRQAEAPT